ncbi:MAG: hypothetical protein QOE64_2381 [Frankiales bacterium]|nr:hypothetical protein [Frankiales bacterium]
MPELVLSIDIPAPQQRVWDAVVDWPTQREWMLLTDVRATADDGVGLGAQLAAFTGIGPVGFLDTMTITAWEPPHRCRVVHTGKVVRGTAAFEVQRLTDGRSRFVWSEWVVLPFGIFGRVGWLFVKPLVALGVRYSLRRLAARLAS